MAYKIDYILNKKIKTAYRVNLETKEKQQIDYKKAQKLKKDLDYQRDKRIKVEIKTKETKKTLEKGYKTDYIFKTDKLGRKYALKIDIASNKKIRVNYEKAIKLKASLSTKRKRDKIKKEIDETGSGATYKEYKKQYKIVEKEIIEKREKEGIKKPLSTAKLRVQVKQKVIHDRIGIATRYRFMWIYKVKVKYIDEITGEIYYDCESPEFTTSEHKMNGDEFENMKEICIDAYKYITGNNLCSLDGGACVIIYNKSDKSIIDQYELGKGCGFSFKFKDDNDNIIYHLEDGYICTE